MNQRSDLKGFVYLMIIWKAIRKIFFKGLKFPIELIVAHIIHWVQESTLDYLTFDFIRVCRHGLRP